jgi:hypothetical protein
MVRTVPRVVLRRMARLARAGSREATTLGASGKMLSQLAIDPGSPRDSPDDREEPAREHDDRAGATAAG